MAGTILFFLPPRRWEYGMSYSATVIKYPPYISRVDDIKDALY